MPADQRAEMQTRITRVAEALFTREGYGKVSLRRIAKEIGCTPMALYSYYDSKLDILQSLWSGVFEQLFNGLAAIPKTGDAATHLSSLCTAYVSFWLERPDDYRLVFMAEGVTQPDVSLFLDTPEIITKYSLFQTALARLTGEEDAKLKLDFILSALHGMAHNQITMSGYDWSSPEAQVKLLLRCL